jgi:hypothetical protein
MQPGLLRRWKRTELIRIIRKGVGLPRGLKQDSGFRIQESAKQTLRPPPWLRKITALASFSENC